MIINDAKDKIPLLYQLISYPKMCRIIYIVKLKKNRIKSQLSDNSCPVHVGLIHELYA